MKQKMTKNPEWKEIILDALMKEQVSSNDLEETEMEDTQRGKGRAAAIERRAGET